MELGFHIRKKNSNLNREWEKLSYKCSYLFMLGEHARETRPSSATIRIEGCGEFTNSLIIALHCDTGKTKNSKCSTNEIRCLVLLLFSFVCTVNKNIISLKQQTLNKLLF